MGIKVIENAWMVMMAIVTMMATTAMITMVTMVMATMAMMVITTIAMVIVPEVNIFVSDYKGSYFVSVSKSITSQIGHKNIVLATIRCGYLPDSCSY